MRLVVLKFLNELACRIILSGNTGDVVESKGHQKYMGLQVSLHVH